MFRGLLQLLFTGCRHSRTSLPFLVHKPHEELRHTDWDPVQPISTSHYVVCLDCGRKLAYDWSKMRVVMKAAGAR